MHKNVVRVCLCVMLTNRRFGFGSKFEGVAFGEEVMLAAEQMTIDLLNCVWCGVNFMSFFSVIILYSRTRIT